MLRSNNAFELAMSEEEKLGTEETKAGSYPQKYWWAILVLLLIALALIKIVPEWRSKKKDGGASFAKVIQQKLNDHDDELEPNDEPAQANILPLEKWVAGNIVDGKDTDFFRITTPPKYRDILQAQIENQSTTLRPGINVFDANKSLIMGPNYNGTPGANHYPSFSVGPDAALLVQVYGASNSTGRYRIMVKPLKKYDSYEPNDDILHAAPIEMGKEISANIMDDSDTDFYRFETGAHGAVVKGHIENKSRTLAPGVYFFDGAKSNVGNSYSGAPGANHDFSFPVQPNAAYFVQVYGVQGRRGDYTLKVTQE
ncbi:MAG: hypothetical protein ABJB09_05840 [Verrucomicrobiota bacterium]